MFCAVAGCSDAYGSLQTQDIQDSEINQEIMGSGEVPVHVCREAVCHRPAVWQDDGSSVTT